MPRGGRRLGAGRKKRTASGSNVLTMPGVTAPTARTTDTTLAVAAPDFLTEGQRDVWKRLAPSAIARGTLTDDTLHGFVLLCDLVDRWTTMKQRIDDDGWTFVNSFGENKRHPLWGVWQALTVRVEQQMARFCLAADGKPPSNKPQMVANPWAQIAPAR